MHRSLLGSAQAQHLPRQFEIDRAGDLDVARVALDDVDEDNGCMYVIPGSHMHGAVDHSEAWMVGERRDMRIPDAALDRERERPITLRAGGCSFHHGLTQHRSGPNRTDRFRRGLAPHYMTAPSRWTGDASAPPAPLAPGRQVPGRA